MHFPLIFPHRRRRDDRGVDEDEGREVGRGAGRMWDMGTYRRESGGRGVHLAGDPILLEDAGAS